MKKFRKIPRSVRLIPLHEHAAIPLPKTCRHHPPQKLCTIRTYRVNQPRLLKIASYSSLELCHMNPSLLQLHRRSECLEDVSEVSEFSRPFLPYSS